MKQKLFTLLLALAASIGTLFASNTQVDGIWYNFDGSTQTAEVTYHGSSSNTYSNEYTGAITVPTSVLYNGVTYTVTSIGSYAFFECSDLTSIEIPNSVTRIGASAFNRCTGLTSMDIPNSVTSIGAYVFYLCSGLTSMSIGNSVTTISSHAFDECSALASVMIPTSVANIEEGAFRNCSALTTIDIPNSVTSIGESAFRSCTGFTSISIPNSVTTIGNGAFAGCWVLSSIEIPNSLTSIGESAFSGCRVITSITNYATMPQVINASTFNDLNKYACTLYVPAESIEAYKAADVWKEFTNILPIGSESMPYIIVSGTCGAEDDNLKWTLTSDSVLTISGTGAMTDWLSSSNVPWYNYRSYIAYVSLPDGLTNIGNEAFDYCSGMTSVTIPNSVTSIGKWAFHHCEALTSIEIPNSVTNIGEDAFQYCSGLTSVTIPNSVTSIGSWAFYSCTGLSSVVWNVKNSADFSKIVNFADVTINAPFYSCTNITSFTFGDEVEHIPAYLCYGMKNLTSIEIPNSVTSIGEYAFSGCSGSSSLTIPNSVTSIGNGAFEGCTNVSSVTIPNSVTSIGNYVFSECKGMTSVTIPNSVTSIGNNAFYKCSGLASITIPNSITNIGNSAFSNCSGLTSVTIPNSVTSISSSAFSGCSNLTSVTISNSVTSIGRWAFENCSGLTSIEIPNSVTSIGISAFSGCSSLTSVTIPNSVTSISSSAFYNCTSMTSVTIPEGITSIGYGAFSNCSGLTSIEIPNSVTSIGGRAFYGCDGLTSITNYTLTPQTVDTTTFVSVNQSSCTLYVPAESIEAYKAADVWKEFTNILPIEGTGEQEQGDAFNLIGITADRINVNSFGDKGTYSMNWIDIPSVNYIDTLRNDMTVTIEGIENFALQYKGKPRDNILKFGPDYLQVDGKNVVLCFSNVSVGDSIKLLVSVKGSSDATFTVLNGAETQDYVITRYADNVGDYVEISFIAISDYVEIKETIGGFRIKNVEVKSPATPAPCVLASGTCGAEGDNLTWTLSCDSVLTISGTGAMADSHWTGSLWYANRESLKSVVIEDGVTSIGDCAFYGCSGLTSITIPNSVTNIGVRTFCWCSSLTSVTIPNSVTSIGEYAFVEGCGSLTSINVANDNPYYCSIDGVLFNKAQTILIQYPEGKTNNSYIIPNSVTSVGEEAFYYCNSLVSVTIPNSVTSIKKYAFYGCSGLTSIAIPNSVISIGDYAFKICKSLTSINVANDNPNYCSIDGVLFNKNLTVLILYPTGKTNNSCTIPNSVTSIENYAFYRCRNLTSITNYASTPQAINANVFEGVDISACTLYIPAESVEAYQAADVWKDFGNILPIEDSPEPCITASGTCGAEGDNLTWTLACDSVLTISGTGAMADYISPFDIPWYTYRNAIKSVVIGNSVTSIGEYAFCETRGLTSVTIPNSVTSIGNSAFNRCNGLTSVTIPNSVTSIGIIAFSGCSSLTSVTIPNSVTSIGNRAFGDCSSLTSIHVANDNQNYYSVEGVLFNKYMTTLVQCPGGKQGIYIIPSSVISIGESAFEDCTSLTSVTIPNSVTSIGASAFEDCIGLTSVTLPSSVTSIGWWAFDYCIGVTSVTNYASTPQAINSSVFQSMFESATISSCTLYVPAESVEAYKAAEVWKEFGNIVAIGSEPEESNYATIADIYNMAADSAFTLGAFDVVYVPSFQNGSNMYIIDSTGSGVIYMPNYGLQAGDHVEAGLQGKVSIYHGLHEIAPVSTKEELTITSGEVPAPMEATEVPSATNVNQYVIYKGVSFSTDTAFVEGKRHAVNGIWNGQTITFYNQYYMSATLSAGKTYNIIAVNTIYGTIPQAYPLAVEEVSSDTPDSCVIASGTCGAQGDNLTWTLSCDSVLTISGTGAMADYPYTSSSPWFIYRTLVKILVLEEGITYIGHYFNGFVNLMSIYSYATTPQFIDPDSDSVFGGVPFSCTLYVPAESLAAYQAADVWKDFGNILPIGGGDTPSPEERTGQSTEGKDFWVTFMQADQDPNNDLVLSLSISSREDCQVMIANPYTGYMETVNVTANQMRLVELYSGNVLLANARTEMANSGKVCYAGYSEQVDTCALRVTATSDISLFATNYKRATCDATNVLPTALLGDEYFIQTYSPSDHGGNVSQGSHFAIVATEDNTIVDYCPTVMTQAINNAIAMYEFTGGVGMSPEELALANWQVGDTIHTPVLMAGQVFYVWTGKKDGDTGDLSGTYVKARDGKRIAVFQGNPHTNVPYMIKQRDQLYSQAMPVRYWGNTFALTSSATRPSDIIRVMAIHDGTEVFINGEPVHTFDFTVDTKHFWEFEIGPSGTYAQEGSCMLATSHPVGVHLFLTSQQYYGDKNSNGDPAMTWVSPIDQQMDQVTFATYESATGEMTSYVNVVTDRPNLMTLDGMSIASGFSPVSGSNIYYYARIPLSYASHTLESNGSRFNAHVYGINSNESYAFSAGGFIEALTLNIYINGEPVSPVNDMCVSDTLFMDITTSFDYQSMKLDFGDGTVVYATDEEGIHARHAYDAPGVYHANVVVASNNNRLDSIPIRIIAGRPSLTYEPLNDIYAGDSIFYIYYHSPIQEMQIEEDFTIDRSFNDAALQDGFGHYTTRLNRSFFGIRIPEGARVGVEYAFNVEIHTLCWDTTATIPFVLKARRTGSCGDNLALTWTYDAETKTLTITGNGALNSNYTFGLEAPAEMEQLIIAEGVTSIGDSAFRNMSTLQTMQLPSSLKTIGAKAFENCINLTSIYNYRERPCLVAATAFNGVNKFDCTLYVLEGSVNMYKSSISDWKDFYFILPIGTTEVTEPVSDVTVEPHDNSATVTWPTSNNAATYTIQITKDGVVFCTLIFNANGQLTGIAFAPSHDGSHHAPAAIMTANGLQFTVTGLNSNTKYGYSVTAKDGNDVPEATYSGEFFTTGKGIATAVDNTTADSKATKLLLNGQIFILRDGKVYDLIGRKL